MRPCTHVPLSQVLCLICLCPLLSWRLWILCPGCSLVEVLGAVSWVLSCPGGNFFSLPRIVTPGSLHRDTGLLWMALSCASRMNRTSVPRHQQPLPCSPFVFIIHTFHTSSGFGKHLVAEISLEPDVLLSSASMTLALNHHVMFWQPSFCVSEFSLATASVLVFQCRAVFV